MFSVLRMESKAQGRFTAVYHGNAPYMGENVAMEGSWIEHARFGRQFDIQSLQVLQPTSVAGIERFLASGAVKGVGPVTAARIVEAFGTDTLEIMGSYPERLAQVRGISAIQPAFRFARADGVFGSARREQRLCSPPAGNLRRYGDYPH